MIRFFLAQFLAILLVWVGQDQHWWPWYTLEALGVLQGAISAFLGLVLGGPRWWVPMHLLFFPAVVFFIGLDLPPLFYLASFLVLVLVYWGHFFIQVPLFLTNLSTARELLLQFPVETPWTVMDAGCGTGALLRYMAYARPRCTFYGTEQAPLPWFLAWWHARRLHNCDVRWGDFWADDWHPMDMVYVFLSPVPMGRVWKKALAEMRPGSILISNSFPVPDVKPAKVIRVSDRGNTCLYVYQLPEVK